jgi:hypothetical protein
MSPHLQKNGPIGALYACSKNGWITEELFFEWRPNFTHFAKPSKDEPILLVLEN